jgi:acetate kinase
MHILVINSGSSSIKFRFAEVTEKGNGDLTTEPATLEGAIKGIGGVASFEVRGQHVAHSKTTSEVRDHAAALRLLFDRLGGLMGNIEAVGHRVVHGGDRYVKSTLITHEVEAGIDELSELAPLHNPACLAGIRAAKAVVGSAVPMVAVFDTAFHQTMPEIARQYAIPTDMADRHHIRRYGFHGIAHASLANGFAASTGKSLKETRLITLQLGNGCSVAAIAGQVRRDVNGIHAARRTGHGHTIW